MTSIADLLGVGSEITFEGVTYKLTRPTLLEQAKFSQWLRDRAKAEAARGDVPEDAREGLYRAAIRDVAEGYYDVDSPGYVVALQRPSGLAKLLHIILQRDHPTLDEGTVQRMMEDGLKEQFVAIVAAETDDPKALAAVLAILGFPPDYLSSKGKSSSGSPTHPSNSTPNESAG
jgi:hypothetical protein